jgi:hypothetical protein
MSQLDRLFVSDNRSRPDNRSGCCTQALRIDKHSSVRQSASDGYSKARRRMSKTIFFLKRPDCLFQEARLKKVDTERIDLSPAEVRPAKFKSKND